MEHKFSHTFTNASKSTEEQALTQGKPVGSSQMPSKATKFTLAVTKFALTGLRFFSLASWLEDPKEKLSKHEFKVYCFQVKVVSELMCS